MTGATSRLNLDVEVADHGHRHGSPVALDALSKEQQHVTVADLMEGSPLDTFAIGKVQSFQQFCTEFLQLPEYTPAATHATERKLRKSCRDHIKENRKRPEHDCILQLNNSASPPLWRSPKGPEFRQEGVQHHDACTEHTHTHTQTWALVSHSCMLDGMHSIYLLCLCHRPLGAWRPRRGAYRASSCMQRRCPCLFR